MKKPLYRGLAIATLYFVSCQSYAQSKTSECFLLMNLKTGKQVVTPNHPFCNERLYAASTFKVPLALMAFDTGLLKDENSPFKWDGSKQPFPIWESDQTTTSWLKYSVIWCSQKLTPELGLMRIQKYLNDWKYGNQDFSGGITRAWLSSTLKISATEQVQFLKRLWKKDLGISNTATEKTLTVIPKVDHLNEFSIIGKTGTGFSWEDPQFKNDKHFRVGWYVGYLTRNKNHFAFAMALKEPAKKGHFESVGAKAQSRALALIKETR